MASVQLTKWLEKVEKEISGIEKRMVDGNSVMAEEDYESLLDYRNQRSQGKLVSREELLNLGIMLRLDEDLKWN